MQRAELAASCIFCTALLRRDYVRTTSRTKSWQGPLSGNAHCSEPRKRWPACAAVGRAEAEQAVRARPLASAPGITPEFAAALKFEEHLPAFRVSGDDDGSPSASPEAAPDQSDDSTAGERRAPPRSTPWDA